MPWKQGQSGNPNGRPRKGNTLTEALTEHVDKDELAGVLYRLALEGNVAAIKYIYDRSEGTPQQHLHVEDERDEPWHDLVKEMFVDRVAPDPLSTEDSGSLPGGEAKAADTGRRSTFGEDLA